MKPTLAVFTFLFAILSVHAQFHGKRIYEYNIDMLVNDTCSGISVKKYGNLDVYCTTNGKWDGVRDNSVCFDVISLTGGVYENVVSLNSTHEDRMIWFADTTFDIPFIKDSVLRFLDYSFRRNCRIKDNERWLLVESFDTAKGQYFIDTLVLEPSFAHCYCGNKFYRNIKGLIVGVKPWDITQGAYMVSAAALAYERYVKVIVDSISASYRTSDSTQYLESLFKDSNYVFAHPDTNKFSEGTHVITVEPKKPITKRQTINAEFWTGTFIQPGVEIEGGIWDSAKKIRHKLEMEIYEANLCLQMVAELVTKGDDKIIFNGGSVSHGSQRACLMFEDKAELVIANNTHLLYGSAGVGILGFKPGAKLVLEDNASIIINNTLALVDYWDNQNGGAIVLKLKPGNKLEFGENASITNGSFEHGSVKLHVYLEGGELDLSNLDEKSKELIVVYNSVPQYVLPNLDQVNPYPNPTSGQFFMEFTSDVSGVLNWQLQDLKGNQIQVGMHSVNSGYNNLDFNFSGNRPGVYIISFDLLGETYYRKVVLVN
jgi:hypothetical protein